MCRPIGHLSYAADCVDREQKWRSRGRCHRRREGKFDREEHVLFENFVYRREILGLPVSSRNVTLMMKVFSLPW